MQGAWGNAPLTRRGRQFMGGAAMQCANPEVRSADTFVFVVLVQTIDLCSVEPSQPRLAHLPHPTWANRWGRERL